MKEIFPTFTCYSLTSYFNYGCYVTLHPNLRAFAINSVNLYWILKTEQ